MQKLKKMIKDGHKQILQHRILSAFFFFFFASIWHLKCRPSEIYLNALSCFPAKLKQIKKSIVHWSSPQCEQNVTKYSIYILKPLLRAAEQLRLNSGQVTGCKIHAPSLKLKRIWRHAHELYICIRHLLCLLACPQDCVPNVRDVFKAVCNNQKDRAQWVNRTPAHQHAPSEGRSGSGESLRQSLC